MVSSLEYFCQVHRVAPVAANTLSVNVFTAPGKAITSTLVFGEHDAVLVDAMMTVAEAEALANWVALHAVTRVVSFRPFVPSI
jgi:hypothetical protein